MLRDFRVESILKKQNVPSDAGKEGKSGSKHTHLLDQADKHVTGPRVAPDEADGFGHAPVRGPILQSKSLDRLVDRLLRHGAVRRPLAARDGQKSARRHVDHVIPYEALRAAGRGVSDQGTQTTPGAENVGATDLDIWGQVASDLLEHPTYLVLRRVGFALDRGRGIRRTSDRVPFPRQEENNSTVGGCRIQETHGAWGVVIWKRDVDAGRRLYDGFVFRVVHR